MKRSTRIILLVIAVALIPVIVKLQATIDPQRQQFQPGKGVASVTTQIGSNPVVLPSQFVAGTVVGFREVVAGLLWVRANDFFHSGNYDAIVPLMRIITWLDPHQIDVYCVGGWHLAYNFVDSAQRADYRYLPPAIAFLEEGVRNNPGVWDPEFDLGFTIYNLKAHDFEKAAEWIKKAGDEEGAPYYIHRQLAHMYVKAGRIDDGIRQWEHCIEEAKAALAKNPKDDHASSHLETSKRNLDLILVRKVMRADLGKHPVDVGFDAQFKRVGPRVFRITGKANLPDFCRIGVTLMDEDYEAAQLEGFSWQVDPDATALAQTGIHGIMVENGKFEYKYDLSKDPKQYPLKKEKYVLILEFNPRLAHDEVQDRLGWSGEGITDKRYLDTSVPGLRKIKMVIHLDRKDIV